MNYVEEILEAFFIASNVVNFLINTSRALKAIELCKESLVLLGNKALSANKPLRQSIYRRIHNTMFKAYRRVSDNTKAIACGRKLLTIYRECDDTVQEGEFTFALAEIYESQRIYAEAKELYQTVITIRQKTGDRRGEAIAFGRLGIVFERLGEYVKAKKYHEKALAISIEIGARRGEGVCNGNLGKVFFFSKRIC